MKTTQLTFETSFDEVERKMTQKFNDRVKLVVYIGTNIAAIYVDDKLKDTKECPTIADFIQVQIHVAAVADIYPPMS